MRQVYLANYLKNQRYQVITYATKKGAHITLLVDGENVDAIVKEIKDIRLSHMQPKKKAQNARKVNLLKMS